MKIKKYFTDRNVQRFAIILSLLGFVYLIPKTTQEIYNKCWERWPNSLTQKSHRFVCEIATVADPTFIGIEFIAFAILAKTSFFRTGHATGKTGTLKTQL